ncbi:MAG: mechanosensitive ion channel [Clostridia bacterium]|nr:mechanosensitive ion channel [Clostridia bacterium]
MDVEHLVQMLQTQGVKLLYGFLVLVIGLFLVHWVVKLTRNKIDKVKIEPTLRSFLDNLVRLVLYIVVILTAAGVMGIPLTSIVTLVASAGVAISLAMQGALSNLVGGVTLLLLKPIMVGEYVKVGDIEGTVKGIGAFYTDLTMPDNRHICMPNSNLTNTAIINYTREGTRRLDVTYSVSYNADMDQVFAVLMELVNRRADVLPDPKPVVHLSACAESSLVFVVRLWCKTADYWDIYYFLLEEGKRALDQAGIEIPYPQMDVHIKQ